MPRTLVAASLCAALAACHVSDQPQPIDASGSRDGAWVTEDRTPSEWLALANAQLDPTAPSADQDPTLARDAAWRAVRAMNPPTAEAWVTLGTACYVAGDLSGALDAYQQALAVPDLEDANDLRAWADEVRAELQAQH